MASARGDGNELGTSPSGIAMAVEARVFFRGCPIVPALTAATAILLTLSHFEVVRSQFSGNFSGVETSCGFEAVMAGGEWVRSDTGEVVSKLEELRAVDREGQQVDRSLVPFKWVKPNCSELNSSWPADFTLRARGQRILFLGDSTMGYLHNSFAGERKLRCHKSHKKQADRCSLDRYYEVPAPRGYPHGVPKLGQGPFKVGADSPGCLDCSGCSAQAQKCKAHIEVEYIPMEFPNDKIVSSAEFPTSQDVLINHYLVKNHKDIVILNMGLHPLAMCHFQRFEENFPGRFQECMEQRLEIIRQDVSLLIRRLKGVIKRVFWITTSAIADEQQDPSRLDFSNNLLVQQLNEALEDVMRDMQVQVVDVYRMSSLPFAMHELHSDPVHLRRHQEAYYKSLAKMVAQAISQNMPEIEQKGSKPPAAALDKHFDAMLGS